jgi:hypothetical protein
MPGSKMKITSKVFMSPFPVGWIVGNSSIEAPVVKAVWLVVPLEYYLVTGFSAGFKLNEFGPAAVFSLLYVSVLFAASCLVALLGPTNSYSARVRIWSIALIVVWSTSIVLVAFSTFVGKSFGLDFDVIAHVVCHDVWSCADKEYPAARRQTFLIYAIYSLAAFLLLLFLSERFKARKCRESEGSVENVCGGPNAVAVVLLNALIMTAMHSWVNSG